MAVGLSLLKRLGESSFWRHTGRLHASLYRATGGRIGHSAGKLKNLLLTTTGRKSGERRTVPLTYMEDGARWILVASNGGADRHPAWWLNLERDPRAVVQVGARVASVTARRADAAEGARLWPMLKAMNPFYAAYEQITARDIPVVILEETPQEAR